MSHALQGYYLCLICCSPSVSYFIFIQIILFYSCTHSKMHSHAAPNQKPSGVSGINCKLEPWAMCLISRIITLPGLDWVSEWYPWNLDWGIIGFISQWWRSKINSIFDVWSMKDIINVLSTISIQFLEILSFKWNNSFLSPYIVMRLSVRINLVFVQRISLNPGLTFVNVMTY